MTPEEIDPLRTVEGYLHDLGARIAKIRLGRNLTQANLAREARASLRSIKRLEAGENTSLDTFIRVLMALRLGDHLSNFLPDPNVRPVERINMKGRERQRARPRSAVSKASDWAWGEEDKE